MAETSIEWADYSFNSWLGCTKVSAACDHCYAETLATARLGVDWGPHAPRRRTAASTWKKPLAWDRKAQREKRRLRVFCASLADVFDNHQSILPEWRVDLWQLIRETPNLDWLLLTKRPQNIAKMLPADWGAGWPNAWLGTTVENQAEADRRIPHLLKVPATQHFLSCEPLLGPVDWKRWLPSMRKGRRPSGEDALFPHYFMMQCEHCGWMGSSELCQSDEDGCVYCGDCGQSTLAEEPSGIITWAITGGESGSDARPMHPDWARSLRDQCAAAGVPFHFKQWGEWAPGECAIGPQLRTEQIATWFDDQWDFEAITPARGAELHIDDSPDVWRLGKKASGRLLDGIEHNGFPSPTP